MLQLTWSWQPALYLFLGGMGAGAFIMAAVLFLIDKAKHRLDGVRVDVGGLRVKLARGPAAPALRAHQARCAV